MKPYADTKRESVFGPDGTEYRMPLSMWHIVAYMASRRGELVTLDAIADNAFVCRESLHTYMSRIRRMLWEGAIVNYRGHGYMTEIVLR